MENYLLQMAAAEKVMETYLQYAKEIGCVIGEGVFSDCVEVPSAEHMKLLETKWQELTR